MVKRILMVVVMLLLAMVTGCGDGPDTPENLVGTAGSGGAVLNWEAVDSGAEKVTYNVYRGTVSGSISTKTKIASDLTATTYTDTTLTTGTTFYYQVTAQDSKGESEASNEVNVSLGTLPAPANLTATTVAGQVDLAWSTVSGATGYNVYRGTTQTGTITGKSKIATGVSTISYSDLTVTRGVTYFYQVTAIDTSSESPGSNEVSVTP
jgi:fibronectin type 3 domain-containing protein